MVLSFRCLPLFKVSARFSLPRTPLPENVKQAVDYFLEHYNGIYKPVKYAAVNKHSLGYDKNSKMVKDFTAGINVIFANSNNAELMDFSA